jgi:deazaflavin-dependent oxidoreductase (nitroreductase family)
MFHYLNPLMRVLLQLPIKKMQERLLLLYFTGRKSGRQYTVPLSYVADDDGSLLLPGGGSWKLNLDDGKAVRVRLQGKRRTAQPEVIRDRAQIRRLLPTLFRGNPRAESFVGVPLRPDGTPDQEKLNEALDEGFTIVRLRLS